MSLNATSVPLAEGWSGFLSQAQGHLPESNIRLILLTLVNIPVIAVVLNVLWQLVCAAGLVGYKRAAYLRTQIGPRNPNEPPVVFHLIPFFGSAAGYGDDPLKFFFECKRKVWTLSRER